MARSIALFALAALCCAAVAAAADPKLMVTDNVVSSSTTKARTASSYYDNTELACLNQLNFKNCRYTGCPVDRTFMHDENCDGDTADPGDNACEQCAPDSIYFQTDFTCCNKEHSYYYGDDNHRHHDIGLAFNDKVGTCDWEISMYRVAAMGTGSGATDPSLPADPWAPHPTDDGTALKWGTAWGTCYLNAEAEHCDSPLCERMAVNIQGGLYATCAYSTVSGAAGNISAQALDTCAAVTSPTSFNEFNLEFILNYIMGASYSGVSGVYTGLSSICFSPAGGRRLMADNAKTDDYHHSYHTQTYYPGIALVLSGPMSIAAKKDHKLEETGMFEQTIRFFQQPGVTTGVTDVANHWPIVTPKGTKLRFTREQEDYYQGGSQ